MSTSRTHVLILGLVAGVAAADSVSLRPHAEIARDATEIRLRDIATLEGPEAWRWADLPLGAAPAAGRGRLLAIDDIRARLDAAGARWDRLDLSGGRVFVRANAPAGATATREEPPAVPPAVPKYPPPPVAPSPPVPAPTIETAPPASVTAVAPVIRPDDRVTVRREVGGIAIPLQAIALDAGAPGQSIRLQMVDRRNRRDPRVFVATVTGPGAAALRDEPPPPGPPLPNPLSTATTAAR